MLALRYRNSRLEHSSVCREPSVMTPTTPDLQFQLALLEWFHETLENWISTCVDSFQQASVEHTVVHADKQLLQEYQLQIGSRPHRRILSYHLIGEDFTPNVRRFIL